MAIQTINNGESGAAVRGKLNGNFAQTLALDPSAGLQVGGAALTAAERTVVRGGMGVASKKVVAQARNIHASTSERVAHTNSNTTPAVTHGVAIPGSHLGIYTGSTLGTSGTAQQNYTITASTDYMVYSFIAYVPAGETGAQIHCNCGFVSGEDRAFTYDWDAPLTASTNVYVPTGPNGASRSVQVENLGGGFRKFQLTLKNDGRTVFYAAHNGTASTTKAEISGVQLVVIKDDGSSLRLESVIPKGLYAPPYTSAGSADARIAPTKKFPFSKVAAFSDSIWSSGAGLASAGAWRIFDSVLEHFGLGEIYSYPGQTTETVVNSFNAINVSGYFDKYLVIFNVGRNDTLSTEAGRTAAFNKLVAATESLAHGRFKVCGVLAKFACTASPGTEETTATNPTLYAGLIAFNEMLRAKFHDKFIDFQSISVNSYDPQSAPDVAAYAIGMRPPSIAPNTGDGTHPSPAETMILGASVVASLRAEYLS